MKIIFMGTPDFAVPILEALHEEFTDIPLVITQPKRKKGRGEKLRPTPVNVVADKLGLKVICPEEIRTQKFVSKLQAIKPDVIVVAAYGKILNKEILDMPRYGCINVHASLLPKYRGAAPIHWAVINGETETGITIMQMDVGMDTGDIISQEKIKIGPDETTGSVHDELAELGAGLMVEALRNIENNQFSKIPQDEKLATYAPKIDRAMEKINWHHTAQEIHNLIRGLNPWPGAYTTINNNNLKVWASQIVDLEQQKKMPGCVYEIVNGEGIIVQAGKGLIKLTELQAPGKRKISAGEFLKGYFLSKGDIFS